MPEQLILVVDDDPFISQVIQEALSGEGFRVERAGDGQEALQAVEKALPNLIIMDYMMPVMDGPEVCRRLQADKKTQHIPIIMVTAVADVKEKVHMLEIGAEDYLVKPFELEELIARVKVVLRRVEKRNSDISELTKLPGNTSINKEIEKRLKSGDKFGICYIDLANFKSFNDRYGFEHGNRVLSGLAQLMRRLLEDSYSQDSFLGHIGGDDFVAVLPVERAEPFCQELINRFDFFILSFYTGEDQKRGYVIAANRQGETVRFPIMRVRIAVVTNEKRALVSLAQISMIVAELKEKAKLKDQSNYVKDERRF